MRIDTGGLQRLQYSCTTKQGNVALGRAAAHQHGHLAIRLIIASHAGIHPVSTASSCCVTHRQMFTDNAHLGFQPHTVRLLNAALHLV